ncbi:MAG: hypothetical protein ABIK89_20105 [Planctomycetota bacterium]
MRKWLVIVGLVVLGVLLASGVGLLVLYRASQHVPHFYQEALQTDPAAAEEASDEMLQQAAALTGDVEKEGPWEAVFTAEQINGWLAVDMARNHPDLLPSSVKEPRVAVEPEQIWIACRLDEGGWSSVVSLVVDAYLAEPNVIALRIRKARVGMLPLPLEGILDAISQEAGQMDLDIRWRQAEGDPVVEVSISPPRDADDKTIRIEALQLGEGKIYLSGSTERP